MNTNIFIAMAVVAGVFAIIMYVMPFLRKKGFDYYNEVKLALMIFGYAFRDDKVKEIANMALSIVADLEKLEANSSEKHNLAVKEISDRLLKQFNIVIDEEALDLLIQLAVSLLPATK